MCNSAQVSKKGRRKAAARLLSMGKWRWHFPHSHAFKLWVWFLQAFKSYCKTTLIEAAVTSHPFKRGMHCWSRPGFGFGLFEWKKWPKVGQWKFVQEKKTWSYTHEVQTHLWKSFETEKTKSGTHSQLPVPFPQVCTWAKLEPKFGSSIVCHPCAVVMHISHVTILIQVAQLVLSLPN